MRSTLSKLFRRSCARREPVRSFADGIRQVISLAPNEGSADRLLEDRLRTFGDDAFVEIYAGDLRVALQAARYDTSVVHPDRFRLDYDWGTGGISATDGRARFGKTEGIGLLKIAGYILGRIREDDLQARHATEAKLGLKYCRAADLRGHTRSTCDQD